MESESCPRHEETERKFQLMFPVLTQKGGIWDLVMDMIECQGKQNDDFILLLIHLQFSRVNTIFPYKHKIKGLIKEKGWGSLIHEYHKVRNK